MVARGIDAEVWDEAPGFRTSAPGTPRLRLMVPERRLVYARWIAHAAGLDTWPDEQTGDERTDDDAPAAKRPDSHSPGSPR